MLFAIIDTENDEIVLTGTESEVCKHMDFIIKTFGQNDLYRINRFEVIKGSKDAVMNFFNFEQDSEDREICEAYSTHKFI